MWERYEDHILSKLKLPPVGMNNPTGVEQERNDVEIGYSIKSFFAGLRRAKTSRGGKWAASLEAPRRSGCRRLVSAIQAEILQTGTCQERRSIWPRPSDHGEDPRITAKTLGSSPRESARNMGSQWGFRIPHTYEVL